MDGTRRPAFYSNLRVNPGLRHCSRLWTRPTSFTRSNDPTPHAQLKRIRNRPQAPSQLLILLNESKNIFSRQLPNMGSDYLTRLVFDFQAETVMILHEGFVRAGICYRIFSEEEFIEIAFCVVEAVHQARGNGRLVMDYLKTVIQSMEIYDILTCADNAAVGYFQKQGFNDKAILMDPKRWVRRIKDYDSVTLSHCHIYPAVDYMNISKVFDRMFSYTENIIGKRLHQPIFDEKDAWVPFPEAPRYFNMSLAEVIARTDCGDGSDEEDVDYEEKMRQLKTKLWKILRALKADAEIESVFQSPVTEEIAPGYFKKINRPMDLQTIERRLTRYPDYYKRPEIFATDLTLMFENCKTFNANDTTYYDVAVTGMRKFRHLYAREFPEEKSGDD
jgi:histone acetyltransferase